jgi:hypothetical protein
MPRRSVIAQCLALAAPIAASIAATGPGSAAEFVAGEFSFSDELGGFRLLSASGVGTPDDPVVIVEELPGIDPVILVIRRRMLPRDDLHPSYTELTLVKHVVNLSERVWAGFEIELQEILRKPSVYSDGLSFKQFAANPEDVASGSFTHNDRRFEPYDRILFQNGAVDPGETAWFRVTITDPTPVSEFYLLQDPNLLSAELPQSGRSYASR